MSKKAGKLVWYAPRWSTVPTQWWLLRTYLLSRGPMIRIAIASTVAVAVILVAFRIAIPAIVFPNLWPLLFVLPGLVVALVLQTALGSLLKTRILVTPKKIVIAHGQTATVIKSDWLTDAMVTVHDYERVRIRFRYMRSGRAKTVIVGVSEDCDLKRLAELLPVELGARDARRV